MAAVGERMFRVQMKVTGRMSLEFLVPNNVAEAGFLNGISQRLNFKQEQMTPYLVQINVKCGIPCCWLESVSSEI